MLLGEMSEIEKSQFLTQQRQFQKLTADIDEMEKEIESTRIQSHQEPISTPPTNFHTLHSM